MAEIIGYIKILSSKNEIKNAHSLLKKDVINYANIFKASRILSLNWKESAFCQESNFQISEHLWPERLLKLKALMYCT